MKKIAILSVVTAAIVAGAIVYLNKQKTPPPPAPVAETAPAQPDPQPQDVDSNPKPQPTPPVATATPAPAAAVTAPPVADSTSNEATNSIRKTVDALLAARGQKHAMFQQLAKDGQLDAVIAELQRRATENPNDASVPTTLGEALLNKVRAMHDAGVTDPTELGILALQADHQFNAALQVDPKNWEAQYVKASSIYYWPPDAARDADAAQRLASLIDQQDTMQTQPQFAQTYVALIKQYQKMGKQDEAAATLRLAMQRFPSDPALQQMAAGK